MKTKFLLIFLSILISFQLAGQTFEEYKKQQENEFAAFKQKQQEFIDQMQNEFDEYVNQRDQEFADFISEQWETFKVEEGEAPPEMPKPPELPSYDTAKEVKTSPLVKQLKNPLMVIEDGKMRPVVPPSIKKVTDSKNVDSNVKFNFYGNELEVDFAKEIVVPPPSQINEDNISNYWLAFSESDFGNLLSQLLNYKAIMNYTHRLIYRQRDRMDWSGMLTRK